MVADGSRAFRFGRVSGLALLAGLGIALAMPAMVAAATSKAPAKKPAAKTAAITERVITNAPLVVLTSDKRLKLVVAMTRAKIYDPATGMFDQVNLRSYVSGQTNPDTPFVAPTIEAVPGEKVEVYLRNDLPAEPLCNQPPKPHNTPHCFNMTNLHTHGLWVSPSDNSDNVFLKIPPGGHEDYVFDIPPAHPAGTFWYHPHNHGSTALQVGGGMAGALIIRGNRAPTATATGDIDALLKPVNPKERVLVFQQIQYACWDKDKIKTNPDGSWKCDPKDVGEIRSYDQLGFDVTRGAERWVVSGRFTSINGEVLPVFKDAKAGQIERWRMIHAGLASTIAVSFRPMLPGARKADRLSAVQQSNWVAQNCSGDAVHQFAYATDGLTRAKIVDRGADKPTVLQPGYREDVLMAFPHPGTYCVIDEEAPAGESITTKAASRQLLGTIEVGAGTNVTDQAAYIQNALVTAAGQYDPAVAAIVVKDLKDPAGMKLSSFVPHPDLRNVAQVGQQQLAFNIGPDASGKTAFMVGTDIADKTKDKPYNPMVMDRTLKLGTIDEWTITSRAASHPYHIHVNPFQIVKILDASGNDVSETGEPASGDMQYADLKGEWKDTILVKAGYTIVFRTKYEQFTGKFVLHCHILDHEDQGMMENVEITADGKPSPMDPKQMDHM